MENIHCGYLILGFAFVNESLSVLWEDHLFKVNFLFRSMIDLYIKTLTQTFKSLLNPMNATYKCK